VNLSADDITARLRGGIVDYLGLPTAGWTPSDFAESLLGIVEEGGQNKGPPDALYNLGLDDGSAWCATAVMAWYAAAGHPLHLLARQYWQWRAARSLSIGLEQYRLGKTQIAAGLRRDDVGFVERKGGSGMHCFLITRQLHDGSITTVEGNVGNRTVSLTRQPWELAAVCRPMPRTY